MRESEDPDYGGPKVAAFFLAVLLVSIFAPQVLMFREKKPPTPMVAPAGVAADIPACGPSRQGAAYLVTDGFRVSDCSIGGGDLLALCLCDGERNVPVATQENPRVAPERGIQ